MVTKFQDYPAFSNYYHHETCWIVKLLWGQRALMAQVPQWPSWMIFFKECHRTANRCIEELSFLASLNCRRQNSQEDRYPWGPGVMRRRTWALALGSSRCPPFNEFLLRLPSFQQWATFPFTVTGFFRPFCSHTALGFLHKLFPPFNIFNIA